MKKIFLILACVVNAWSVLFQEMQLNCNAQTRSNEEIRSIALSKLGKMKTNNPSVSRRVRAASSNELKMYIENDVLSLLGFPEGGYVVVSNDERNVPVLAYSDAKFDVDSQSPGFNWWMETIQQSLEKGNTVSYASTGNGGRGPLLTTTWDQREPYNNMAPLYTQNGVDYKCVTGCIPTAMAQVVNYHKYPTVGIGQKTYDAYMSDTGTYQQLSFDFSATTFDWENMLDSYRGQYNEEQANAVATLMYACGVSIGVSYGTSGSGGSFDHVPQGLKEHFGYSAYFGVFSSASVKTEIDNGNPILYAGGNHVFVIDGYDDDGLLHLNMGWGGFSDGYYLMTDMNGFAGGQVIFVHNPNGAAQDYFDVTIGEFSFNLYGADASACVLAYNGSNKHMVIPETVTYDGYTYVVKKIEDRSGTYHAIESISLPSTLEEIGALTFDYTNLKEIVLPEGLRSIGQQAFAGSKIEKINIPSTVESIGTFAFSFCQYLTDIEVSNDNRYFSSEGGALYDKDFQKLICLPAGIKTSFVVKEGVKIIGSGACSGTYTSEIILPQSLKRIDEEAFSNTRNLKQIIIPEGCAYVGRNAFAGGQVLSMIKIPSSVTYIGDLVFNECPNLKEIIVDKGNQQYCAVGNVLYNKAMTRLIAASPKSLSGAFNVPNTVSTISNYAFCCCNQLTYINIPSSVNNIASSAFMHCTRLETIVLPEGVTKIDAQLFWRCLSLKEVYIPSTVTSISGSAFTACNSLEKIICAANIPPFTDDKTFRFHSMKVDLDDFPGSFGVDFVDFTGNLYIPETSVSSYKTAQEWKDMANVKALSSVHALKYVVDEKVYMTNFYETNEAVDLLAEPYQEGYTFSGWSEDLKTMPNHDVTISGIFIKDRIQDTDIASYPYIVHTVNQTVRAGKAFTLPINMKNADEDIVGFQCDIELPSCVELEKNSRGSVKAPSFNAEADRTSNEFHTVSAAEQEDGSVRVLCYSASNEVILGTDGTVCDFNALLAEGTLPGEYAIKMKNIIMTTAQSQKYVVDEAVFVITVPAYIKGDANGDEAIDVADIAATANHILGNEAENFVKEAADMDDDDVIDVADIAGIANLILYGDQASVKGQSKVATRAAAAPSLGVASFKVESGATTASPTLNLSNAGYEFCGFQCDMYFPEGISWAKNSRGKLSAPTFNAEADRTSSEYHTVSAALQENGAVRILCYSNENEIFLGEDGAILNLPITFESGLADGVYDVVIKNIVLSRPTQPKVTLDEYRFTITVGNANVEIALNDGTAYVNASAQQVSKLTYTRTFNNTNWQALYVPFAMNYEDWADEFEVARLNDVHQFDEDEDGEVDRTALESIKLKAGKSTEPNVPYMIKAKTTGTKTITLTDATLYPAEENSIDCSSVGTLYTFTGTYHNVENMATNGYYAMAGGGLKLADSDAVKLAPFRWYLSITDRYGKANRVKSIDLVFDDGETTSISNLSDEDAADGVIYSLDGKRVNSNGSSLPKGLYIINGKKTIIK